MTDGVPKHQGWFANEPQDPTLTTELLLIERSIETTSGPWRIDGALVKNPGEQPTWVEGWIDDYWSAEPHELWEYLVDKGGGNGMSWEVAFFRIASAEDAPKVATYYNDKFALENPFGFKDPVDTPVSIVHESVEDIEEISENPCESHVHVDMPYAAADALTWRIASELVRRHPEDLWVVRTFTLDGFYDCLSIRRLPDPLTSPASIAINRRGTHVKVGWLGKSTSGRDDDVSLSWGNAYAGLDPRPWLRQLEASAGLDAPKSGLPPSTPSSLAIRWIAAFLALQAGSRPRWTAWNDWSEVDSGVQPADFDKVPAAGEWLRRNGGGKAAARVVFVGNDLGPEREPRFALSTEGDLWRVGAAPIKLTGVYESTGRQLVRTVLETAGNYLP